jgi:soluble lytic murein transglycosylase
VIAGDALAAGATCWKKMKKPETAAAIYDTFIQQYPWHPRAADVLWTLGRDQEASGDLAGAIERYHQIVVSFPKQGLGGEALWREGYCRYKMGAYSDAVAVFSLLTDQKLATLSDQAWYWLAKSCLANGQAEDAWKIFLSLKRHYPRTYYAVRAAQMLDSTRLTLPAFDQYQAGVDPLAAIRQSFIELKIEDFSQFAGQRDSTFAAARRHLAKCRRLLNLDLPGPARNELVYLEEVSRDRDVLFEVARIFFEHGQYDQTFHTFYRLFRVMHTAEDDTFPVAYLRFLYPLFYYDQILAQCPVYPNLDPFLVLAVMHQESRFNPRAKSPVKAMGLMQVMPRTGRLIARDLKLHNYKRSQLFDPEVNIRFGMHYLSRELQGYRNNLGYTLASYNGGGYNVEKWRSTLADSDFDVFVEDITFSETRQYVKVVWKNYWLYYELWKQYCVR